ncbi:MAG: cytochrome c [Bacteroidetes bacterium]|nr:cytochrome c [Bacteroidota bacterium]
MYSKIKIVAGIIALTVFAACSQSEGNFAGWEYAPDMYYAKGPEAYRILQKDTGNSFKAMWTPVTNTIARGKLEYVFPYNNDTIGYRLAKKEVKCLESVPPTLINIQEGKRLFDINCIVCHGKLGRGDGTIVKDDKFPPPPAYQSFQIKTLEDGGKYFSITYGKNNMGAYGPNLSPEERWKVIHYVNYLSHIEDSTATLLDLKEEGYLDFYKK